MENEKILFGKQGELDASRYALSKGYWVIGRNYRTPYGEIDLVLKSPEGEIVFVEVKARTGTFFGYPESAVNERKKTHMINSALCYMQREHPENDEIPWRIDIIALIYKKDRKTIRDLRWFENVTADE